MSFDRPGLPHPGHELRPEVDDALAEEGVEFTDDDEPDIPEHPGSTSAGPQPNPARRPPHETPPPEAPLPEPEADPGD
ncbi:hypothetical protein AB0E69_15345 [Kribbella sp. NPDC026611]|uniref:hypothetical protein n=1 Tax=Kribbella sp. NPDC026611 TaxID=3154911 RepID=UPI0033E77EE3